MTPGGKATSSTSFDKEISTDWGCATTMSQKAGKAEATGAKELTGARNRTISITKWNGDPNIKGIDLFN